MATSAEAIDLLHVVSGSVRIVYILPSVVPPPADPLLDRVSFFSDAIEGEILQPTWFGSKEEAEAHLGVPYIDSFARGSFRYRFFLANRPGIKKWKLRSFVFYVRETLRLHRERKFDCIVVYAHQTTGLIGILLKWLTGAKLVIEIMTSPHLIGAPEQAKPSWRSRLRRLYSDLCLHATVRAADRVHLLYPEQLRTYPSLRGAKASVFHDFVSTTVVGQAVPDMVNPFVLLIGSPWYLKGFDRAIRAFRSIRDRHPNVRLVLQGHVPETEALEALIGDDARIELHKPMLHGPTYEKLRHSCVLLHPSRVEGLPRVVIEAMSAGLPVVASDVGGIPWLLRDGVDGFVATDGDGSAIADHLDRLLSDPELRARMGASGQARVQARFSDHEYAKAFEQMIRETVSTDGGA